MIDYSQLVKDLRLTFECGRSKDVKFRLTQLKNILRMYEENTQGFIEALQKDLRKPAFEGYMYEVLLLKKDVKMAIKKLRSWTSRKKLPKNLISLSDNVYYDYQPHGLVLIMGPWNYPVHLTLMPLVGAVAAGNCALMKPSEISSHCSALLSSIIPKYLDQECYKIVQGDATETQKIMKEKFDFIFFTGSPQIGKIIYSEAALTLTPVCLELGGKSPVYIDSSADLEMSAERIMWAKCVCLGQTCISPDYILCTKDVEREFVKHAKAALERFFGDDAQQSPDLSRIINLRHFGRIRRLLEETRGSVVLGGKMDEHDLYIEPTIVVGVDEHEPLMCEEIFGPILPIFPVKNSKDAIEFINNRPNPLALYIFTKKQNIVKPFLDKTRSGGVSINDALYHTSVGEIPFGGLGESGLGQYHGKFSFETFSRPRAVVHRTFSKIEDQLNYKFRYPPYTDLKFKVINFGLGYFESFYVHLGFIPYLLCFSFGMITMFVILKFLVNV